MNALQVLMQMEAAGAQMVAHALEENLQETSGMRITTLALYWKTPLEDWGPERCLYSARPHPVQLPGLLWRLRQAMRRQDIVISHTHYANVIVALARIGLGTRQIAVHHGPRSTHPRGARWLESIATRLGLIHHHVAVSEPVADELRATFRSLSNQKLSVIDNPIPRAALAMAGQAATEAQRRTRSTVQLVAVGRLVEQKNHALLIDAVHELRNMGVKCSLQIWGRGPLETALRDQISSKDLNDIVQLCGEGSHSQVMPAILEADYFVTSSVWEAAPMSLLEASALGATVIASDIPSHRYVLADSGNYFKDGSPKDLARAISHCEATPRIHVDAKRQWQRQAERFDPARVSLSYGQLIRAVASSPCRAGERKPTNKE